MMSVLLAVLLTFVQPDDESTYYGMDLRIAQFSRYWEEVYETSLNGFRTSQGCHDMRHWYQIYEAKTEVAFARIFNLRYNFYMIRDYETSITTHRFEPEMRIWRDLRISLVAVPSYFKKEDEAGLGLAWRRGSTDWLAIYAIAQGFDHNLSLMYTPAGPKNDSFMRTPYKFELDARGELSWIRLRLHGELGTPSLQRLHWPDSACYEWECDHDQSLAWGRLELRPLEGLWLGSRVSWRLERTRTRWPAQERTTADTLLDRWVEPFLAYSPTPRLELSSACQLWGFTRDMDSANYRRDYTVLTWLMSWNPLPFLVLEAGYQRAWRYIYNDDTLIAEPYSGRLIQSRLLLNLEMRFKSGLMFTVKEGIEMDNFPKETFWHPHNHTYVSLHMPLGFLKDDGKKD